MPSVMAFSDGGCNDNGKASASAAFAAVIAGGQFGRSEIRGTVEPFTYALVDTKKPSLGFRATEIGCTPTNNRAELLGICWMFLALLRGFAFGRVTAVSDSEISVKTLNEWLPQRRAGKKAKGELKNMDLLEIAEALFAALKEQTLSCDLEHTRSHTQLAAGAGARERIIHGGNARADALATETLEDGAALEITSPLVCVRALVLLRSVL
jgi:ribonuclease HI